MQFVMSWFINSEEFSGGPVVKTLWFQCRECRFDPWSGSGKKKKKEFILSFNKPILITGIKNRDYNTNKSDDIKRKCLVLM